MPAIIRKVLALLAPYLAAALILCSAAFYILHLQHNLKSANAKNITLLQTNRENLAAIATYQAREQKWNDALSVLDAQTLSANTATAHILETINSTPASEDASVAPVLANALAAIGKMQDGQK